MADRSAAARDENRLVEQKEADEGGDECAAGRGSVREPFADEEQKDEDQTHDDAVEHERVDAPRESCVRNWGRDGRRTRRSGVGFHERAM